MSYWQPSESWWRNHTTSDLVYTVTLAYPNEHAASAVWQALREIRTYSDDGEVVYDGGTGITRAQSACISCDSGGEDALDSLESSINEALEEARLAAAAAHPELREALAQHPRIVDEQRQLEP